MINLINGNAKTLEEIVNLINEDKSKLIETLSEMELEGKIVSLNGGRYFA